MKMKYVFLGIFALLAICIVGASFDADDSDAVSETVNLGQKTAGTQYEYSQNVTVSIPSYATLTLSEVSRTNCNGNSPTVGQSSDGFFVAGAYSPTSSGSFSFTISVEESRIPGLVYATHTVTFTGTAIVTYTCNLYYDANGGTGAPNSQSYTGTSTYHNFTIRSGEPTRAGYEFLGWSTSSTATTPSYYPGGTIRVTYNNPITLKAVWGVEIYATYDLGELVVGTSNYFEQEIASGSPSYSTYGVTKYSTNNCSVGSLTASTSQNGFTVAGYTGPTAAGSFSYIIKVEETRGPLNTLTYFIKFTGTGLNEYTCYLNYDANGGTGAPESESYTSTSTDPHDFTISDTEPTRSGYEFLGWSTSSTATTPEYSPGDTVSVPYNGTVDLMAVWGIDIYATYSLGSNLIGETIEYEQEVVTDSPSYSTFEVVRESYSNCGVGNPAVAGSTNGFTVQGVAVPSSEGPFSFILKVTESRGPLNTIVYFIQFTGTGSVSPDEVFWSNDNYNGRVDIVFKFTSPSQTHVMQMDLYTPTTANHRTVWTDTGKDLTVTTVPTDHRITVSITDGQQNTYNIGSWNTYVISIDTEHGNVSVTPIMTFSSFTDFTVNERQKHTILDFSSVIKDAAIHEISHSDTGDQANRVRFSVVDTWPFLDSYGVILQDPSLNFHDYFPQFDSIRVNFYSFALFGESITINGITYPVTDGKVTVTYVTDDGHNYLPEVMPNRDPTTRTFELNNIYVTYSDDGHAYLTFADKHFTLDLGLYQPDQWVVSMSGMWYFTSMAYEPYTATEKSLSGWKTLPTTSANEMILIFLGILCVAFAAVAIHVKRSGFGIVDLIIIGSAALVAFLLLG